MNLLNYNFLTENNKQNADRSLLIIIRLMLIAWVAMKVMSWKLWLADRSFPLVAVIPLPHPLHLLLFILFFVFSLLIFSKPAQPYLLCILILVEIISMLGDQLRWHPWEYQFLFICLAVVLSRRNSQNAINSIIFIFACSYFFSGISKVNGNFLNNIWLRLTLIKVLHFPRTVYYNTFIRYAGLLIPLVEIGSGVLLVMPKYFKITAWMPIGVHLLIIVYISPLLLDYDYIVFPWNLFMISTVYLLFVSNKTVFSFRNLLYRQNAVIAFAWTLLPIAGMFEYWPPFFSFKLYSGTHVSMVVYVPDTTNIPSEIKPYIKYSTKGYQDLHFYFSPFDWCNDELKVPIPPERRIYESLQNSFDEKYKRLHPVYWYY